tara:strand:- start:647 stop:1387 length:741 start_codon:yes stop_codon:yes gene_type:complete
MLKDVKQLFKDLSFYIYSSKMNYTESIYMSNNTYYVKFRDEDIKNYGSKATAIRSICNKEKLSKTEVEEWYNLNMYEKIITNDDNEILKEQRRTNFLLEKLIELLSNQSIMNHKQNLKEVVNNDDAILLFKENIKKDWKKISSNKDVIEIIGFKYQGIMVNGYNKPDKDKPKVKYSIFEKIYSMFKIDDKYKTIDLEQYFLLLETCVNQLDKDKINICKKESIDYDKNMIYSRIYKDILDYYKIIK